MPRESKAARAERAHVIVRKLFAAHPDAHCELDHADAYQLLCATILSAQCTDKMVNRVTPALFARYPDAAALSRADAQELEEIIHATGFFRSKARSLIGMARAVVKHHDGRIPATMKDLVGLPGVGRKTANVILGNAFGVPGLVVDTHVARIAGRLGLTRETDAVKIEHALEALVDPGDWTQFSHAMIFHGRRVCAARRPQCVQCCLLAQCPYGAKHAALPAAPAGAVGATLRARKKATKKKTAKRKSVTSSAARKNATKQKSATKEATKAAPKTATKKRGRR